MGLLLQDNIIKKRLNRDIILLTVAVDLTAVYLTL